MVPGTHKLECFSALRQKWHSSPPPATFLYSAGSAIEIGQSVDPGEGGEEAITESPSETGTAGTGRTLVQGRSGKVDGAGPPLTGSAGVSLPRLGPTLLQGGSFGSPRAMCRAGQPGSGPCRTPCSYCHPRTRGSGPLSRTCPTLTGAWVTSPSWLSDKSNPPLEGRLTTYRLSQGGLMLVLSPD